MRCKRGIITVLSPAPCTEIDAKSPSIELLLQTSEVIALTVCCVNWDGTRYFDQTVTTLTPSADTPTPIQFPTAAFPHGPLTVRILVGDPVQPLDICNLQLYNRGGIAHKEGISAFDTPVGAKDMHLVYADDFDRMPLISASRTDADYYSHKPGGGDFSRFPFSDFESEKNPFFHTDTYFRIRADQKKNSSGLISCVKADGSGFEAAAPCYFECRFMAPNAIGSWPAFWLLTNHVKRGNIVPVDELDTIEAYGLEDLDHQNRIGYYVTSHRWNQDKAESIDPEHFIDMRSIGTGLLWDACFHTYGTRITADETVYFCDDIPVYAHPTQSVSKEYPFYFMLNLAVGGNGWPYDISQYGQIELFADFIRVYAG